MADLRGKSLLDLLMDNVSVDPVRGCWLWAGQKLKAGYGCMGTGPLRLAHRASWMMHHGHIPEGLYVCHKCDVKSCVNPDHLELGTPLKNTQDAKARGLIPLVGFALRNTLKTHCQNGHPFDRENATLGRHCSKCKSVYFAAYREKNLESARKYDADWQMKKRRSQGVIPKVLKTHCKVGHALTPDNVFSREKEGGGRRCRTCVLERNRIAKRRYRAEKKLIIERRQSCL